MLRHFKESGRDNILFAPFPPDFEHDRNFMIKANRESLLKTDKQVNWRKIWGYFDDDKLIGHVDLKGAHLDAALHRCVLGMGIEFDYHRQGIASNLMEIAINWCKENEIIEYLDLYVFEHNYKARNLYKKFGFKEIAKVDDMFRTLDKKINDIHMSLKV